MTPARLELDFIAPPRRPAWPGVLLLAAALAAATAMGLRYRDLQLELARLATASGLVSPERAPARIFPKERIDEEAKLADAVVRQLALPWAGLIETVEEAATADVAILLLQPDAQQRVLRLTAVARNRDAMFQYLRRLGAAPALAGVHLIGHQVQLEDPQRPVQFSVQAGLRNPG